MKFFTILVVSGYFESISNIHAKNDLNSIIEGPSSLSARHINY